MKISASRPLVVLPNAFSLLLSCHGQDPREPSFFTPFEGEPEGLFVAKPIQPGLTPHNFNAFVASDDHFQRQYARTHINEVGPIGFIARGNGPVFDIEYDENLPDFEEEIENLEFASNGALKLAKDVMEKTSTDGMMVVWHGKIVYEKYFDAGCGECEPKFNAGTRHMLYSVSKSYIGILVSMLIQEGKINEDDLIVDYIEELKVQNGAKGAFADATVREILDMTAQYVWAENGAPGPCEFYDLNELPSYFQEVLKDNATKIGVEFPVPQNCEQAFETFASIPWLIPPEQWWAWTGGKFMRYPGAQSHRDYLLTLKNNEAEPNNEYFFYRTANTNVLAWLIEKVTGENPKDYFSEKLWSKVGQNFDAAIQLDTNGRFPYFGGGAMATLKDAARFGEMMRNDGRNAAGDQVVPKVIVDDIKGGGTPKNEEQFRHGKNPDSSYNCAFLSYYCDGDAPEDLPATQYLKALGLENEREKGLSYRNQYWVWPGHMFYQSGNSGQYVVVFPEANLVVTKLSSYKGAFDSGDALDDLNLIISIAAKFAEKSNQEMTEAMADVPLPDVAVNTSGVGDTAPDLDVVDESGGDLPGLGFGFGPVGLIAIAVALVAIIANA